MLTSGKGVTKAERYLKRLCDHTFLSLWSYSSIFRDQGNAKGGDGKEICDLLVVFGNHIIIFSDKDCEYPSSDDKELNWKRWYRKAITKSVDQIWGAERWIKQFPERLFLDRQCEVPFPVPLPKSESAIFHRIVVAHSASEACKRELGGSGSLMLMPGNSGFSELSSSADSTPFVISDVSGGRGFVHVFDDTTLDIVMQTVDTITDFVKYLQKKEAFLSSGKVGMVSGEDDLLSLYLRNMNAKQEHDFPEYPDAHIVTISEGHWEEFCKHPQRLAQLKADEVSYAWDSLIETFVHHIKAGTAHYASEGGFHDQELAVRWLASESRLGRRFLAESLIDFIEKTPATHRATRTIKREDTDLPYHVFLLLPHLSKIDYETYRTQRRTLLEQYCVVAKVRFPEAKHIIGIATESGRDSTGSEDCVYLDTTTWNREHHENALDTLKILQASGLLGKTSLFKQHISEYPIANKAQDKVAVKMHGTNRNKPCPCGSGKKFKKCCG